MWVVFVLLILFEVVNISSQTKQTKSLVSEIVDQLSLSNDLQANIFNGNYNSNDVRNVLKDNRVNYKTFYYNLRSSVNEDFSNTVNYAYSRANFLFDEDEEVIYWLSEYSTYLRGLKNRISNNYSQPNYLAKNNSKAKSSINKTNSKKNSVTPIVKKVTPKKEIIKEPSPENSIETQKTTVEDTPAENSTEIAEDVIQEPSSENSIETQQPTIENTPAENSTEIVEDVVQESSAENSIETQKITIEDIPAENNTEIAKEIVQEPSAENSIETQQPTIENTPAENSTEIVEDVIQESSPVVIPKENTPKKEQPIITNDSNFELSYSAKVENELANKAVLYYTVRVKSVSNPTDGLKFLSKIKDNDAVWDEHTFHLFKDKEKENITNITIGKFVDKENAEELMAYLKTKNITNPSIEIHENNIKSTVSNVKPISKPVNTTKPRAAIENPVNKVVESPRTKKEVSSNKNLLDNISTKVDESENYFSVQVGANNKISSTNIQGLNLNKEKLFFVNIEKGKYAMNYGKHEDYGSAHKIALEIHKKGLETAFVTKYENGVRVKVTKNDYLTDKTPKKTISDDINQLGYIPIGPNNKGKFIQIGTIYNWDAHNFKLLYDQLERSIYYKIKENNSVIFLVGPLQENEVFIELRNVKQVISDAFIKTI